MYLSSGRQKSILLCGTPAELTINQNHIYHSTSSHLRGQCVGGIQPAVLHTQDTGRLVVRETPYSHTRVRWYGGLVVLVSTHGIEATALAHSPCAVVVAPRAAAKGGGVLHSVGTPTLLAVLQAVVHIVHSLRACVLAELWAVHEQLRKRRVA